MGIQRANPTEYVARYGTQLADAHTLITTARQAGVVEDIVSIIQCCVEKKEDFVVCLDTTWWSSWISISKL